MNNELAQVDRGLYGANLHFESQSATSFGERRFAIDGFTAEPGTIASREEFRGTGGSLYFLRRQDILAGSERVRIELRDRASGLVTGVVNLTPAHRLRDRLPARPNPADRAAELDARATTCSCATARCAATRPSRRALRVHAGVRGARRAVRRRARPLLVRRARQGRPHGELERRGRRRRAASRPPTSRCASAPTRGSSCKARRREGFLSNVMRSDDGGFGFSGYDDASFANADAGGYRADVSLGLGDFLRPRARPRHPVHAEPRRRLRGAGPADADRHRALRRHVPDAGHRARVAAREVRPAQKRARAHGERARAQRRVSA